MYCSIYEVSSLFRRKNHYKKIIAMKKILVLHSRPTEVLIGKNHQHWFTLIYEHSCHLSFKTLIVNSDHCRYSHEPSSIRYTCKCFGRFVLRYRTTITISRMITKITTAIVTPTTTDVESFPVTTGGRDCSLSVLE